MTYVFLSGSPSSSIEDVFEAFVVVDDWTTGIIERSGDASRGVAITHAHQREQLGLAHALLQAEPYVDEEFD